MFRINANARFTGEYISGSKAVDNEIWTQAGGPQENGRRRGDLNDGCLGETGIAIVTVSTCGSAITAAAVVTGIFASLQIGQVDGS